MNFINGVILIEKMTKLSTIGSILVGVLLIILMIMIFGGCRLTTTSHRYAKDDAVRATGIALIAIGFGIMVPLSISAHNKQLMPLLSDTALVEYTGQYRVTVTDNVDMNEFTDKYEIVDYNNGVYTIKVK